MTVAPVWYALLMVHSRIATSVSSTIFQCVSSILGYLPFFLPDYLLCIGEGVRWDVEKGSHVWRVCPLFSGEEGIFSPGHDVAGLSIRGMVIVFDALGASDDLVAKVPETAEARPSLYSINRPYDRPDVFCTVFHHACYLNGIHLCSTVRDTLSYHYLQEWCLWTLYLIAIYRSSVFAFRIVKHTC